jgi:hypothetical protein
MARHSATLKRQSSRGFSQPERSSEKDTLDHFERFCFQLKLPDTLQPFRLEDWQCDALRDYFEHGALEHLWLWPTGLGKCLAPDTMVALADGGRRRADEIAPGNRVLGWGGYGLAPSEVLAVEEQAPQACVEVETVRGRILRCTTNHPVLTLPRAGQRPSRQPRRYAWTPAGRLGAGDYVVVGLGFAPGKAATEAECERAWLAGVLVGDGSLSSGNCTLTSDSAEVVARVAETWPVSPVGKWGWRLSNPNKGKHTGGPRSFVKDCGLLGKTSYTKRVPGWVFMASREAQAQFLSGYLDTDGGLYSPDRGRLHDRMIEWYSVNRELLVECQHLLAGLGVNASIAAKRGTYKGQVHHSWRLWVGDAQQILRLGQMLKPTHATKAATLKAWMLALIELGDHNTSGSLELDRVKAIRPLGKQSTIAIQVAGTESHVTGGLVTHNSTLLGALALHHGTFVRINPKVIILGGMGGHGKHTLNAAAHFIAQSQSLSRWWVAQEYGMGRIKSLIKEDSYGLLVVSSAGRRVGGRGGSGQEGEAPSLVLVEELHRHEDDGAAVRTLTTKVQKRTVGKHRVRIVHVTTAGDSLDSTLGRMVTRALRADSVIEEHGDYTRAVDADGDLVMHRWAVPDEVQMPASNCSREELDAFILKVKKANPGSFIKPENLRRSYKASQAEPWVFARQHMNHWVNQMDSAFSRYDWNQGEVDGIVIPTGAQHVFVGLDTATSFDTTAVIPVWIDPSSHRPRTAGGVILKSEEQGTKRRLRVVFDVLEVMRARWPGMTVVFDRNMGGGLIAEQMEEDYGMTVIDHGQGVPMEAASMLLGELIAQHEIDHDGSSQVTEQVLAAVPKVTYYGTRWRIEQPRSKEPIDAAVALAMALNAAKQAVGESIDVEDYRIELL